MSLRLLPDNEKINLTSDDIFDRVVNLKIQLGKPARYNIETGQFEPAQVLDEYVIRSDYEIVYLDMNVNNVLSQESSNRKFIIRKCTHKPSIKVQCTMVTANTGTSIDIFVSNFFIFTSGGQHLRSFSSGNYAVLGVDIAMGYFGQFKDTIDFNKESKELLKDYFTIKAVNGADMISLQDGSVYVTTDKMPPDSVLHIHGMVGNITSNPVAISKVETYDKAISYATAESNKDMESLFFEAITRRYLKGNKIRKLTQPLYNKRFSLPESAPKVDAETGLMSKEDAEDFGVKVYLSEGAKAIAFPKTLDSEGKEVPKKIYFELGYTIGHTMTRIISFLGNSLEYRFTNNGNVLVYSTNEADKIDELAKSFKEVYKETVLTSVYRSALPAVYNINIDAIATITCPFFTFIEPFQEIEFSSRYALTSMVDYYAEFAPTINRFIATKVSVSFATVENVNETQITAVSVPEGGQIE